MKITAIHSDVVMCVRLLSVIQRVFAAAAAVSGNLFPCLWPVTRRTEGLVARITAVLPLQEAAPRVCRLECPDVFLIFFF